MSTIAVLGAGPGLGRSVARRFAKEGYAVGLVSRSTDRHPAYLEELSASGVPAVAVAADLRTYARALAAAAEDGVHVGSLVVGGLIERGDIHQMLTDPATPAPYATLDPDELADAVWRLASGTEDEVVFDAVTQPG